MNKKAILLFLGCIFLSFLSVIGNNSIPFKHYNYENGLISNWVNSIIQDQDGFIWIGTADGLCRFNGYSFDSFENIPSDSSAFADNFISSIAEDSTRNCLWLVTSTGISKFDKTSYQFKNYGTFTTTNSTYSPFARGSVCVDSHGNIWVEGFNKGFSEGLFTYLPKEDKFVNVSKINKSVPKNLTAICEDKNQRLWFGSENGLYYYLPESDSYHEIKYRLKNGDPLHITTLYVDSKNTLWIGSKQSNSIYICVNDSISKYFEPVMETTEYNWISTITSYNNDVILAGIKDLGVMILNQSTGESDFLQPDLYNPKGLQSKTPNVMYTDKFGNVWIGSYNNGLNFIDKNRKLFDHYHFNYTKSGLLSNCVRALFEDSDGELWVGTKEGGGISKFNSKEGLFENHKADKSKQNWINNDIVIAINELEAGKLLVGTFGSGIFTYYKKENIFSQFSKANQSGNSISDNNVYAIYKDFDGKIWIGNNSYTDIYDPNTEQFSHVTNATYARCFLDLGENVLIGTWSNGVYKYNKTTKQVENYPLTDFNLPLDKKTRINDIAQDRNGTLWFASNKGLIQHKPKSKKTKFYTVKNGLNNDNICALVIDDNNNVWVSTKGGISKLSANENTFKNYDKHDGLQSNVFEEFVSLKTKDGKLLFSGTNGFNIFHPDSIKDNPNIPNVIITEMQVLNEPVKIGAPNSPLSKHISLTKKLELSYEQSSFSFEFIGINYTSPENNQYRYKLEGYDDNWKDAKHSRIATYTHLPAGDYVFKVIASNNDGLWNKKGASVEIIVWPPFWKSKTAIVIYFILLIGLLFLFTAIITYRTNHENKLKAEILEKHRIEETDKNRLKFFTNISHELRTPLTLISAPLEKIIHYDIQDQKLKSRLLSMNRNAQRLLRLINQLMDFRSMEENRIPLKVSQGNIIEDSQEIFNSFDYLAQTKNIELHFTSDQKSKKCWYDCSILDKILFNLLSNAIKFTPKGGNIELSLCVEENKAIFKVKDSGVGIPADSLLKVFDRFYTTDFAGQQHTGTGIGLSFTKSLVTLHKGSIGVESEMEKGSCFTFVIPIAKNSFDEKEICTDTLDKPQIANETKVPTTIPISIQKSKVVEKNETLMIVEDHDDLREYLISSFSEYNIIECPNGKIGMEQAKEQMPDLILSDIMMPEMNGLELCNAIKTSFITSHIPVILLTARTADDQKLEGFKHHADAYIEKPFNIDLLKVQVENMLQFRENIKKKYKQKISKNKTRIDEVAETIIPPLDKMFLDKVSELIRSKISDFDFSVESLSSELGMSRSQLFRKFKALLDTTPSKYIRDMRLQHAANLLIQQQFNVNEVTFMVGFSDVSHFISLFKNQYGQTPKQFSESQLKKQIQES
ncbi:two-component regulator propeller domain-containing protein [Labilibaculum sp.]|uniref:hybrid sensor histidine kinase/response regulator transcription factor n=1 Tax=Labilibaculum sp. TaxID=2060723 RepID=UPI0035628DE2